MSKIFPSPQAGQVRLLALVSLAYLSACAPLPSVESHEGLKPANAWATAESFKADESAWPEDGWWKAYGDAQLNTLIDDALKGAPNLQIAQARLRQAAAVINITDSATGPQLSANASATEEKQSYNYLMPRSSTPQGWNDYGRATLDFSWEMDFWGRNRSALSAAISEHMAAQAEVAQARLILTTSIANAYAELAREYAARETAESALDVRSKTAHLFHERKDNGMETLGSVRQADARQASAEGDLLQIDEQIALQRNRLAALAGLGPDRGLHIGKPSIQLDHIPGLPKNLALDLLGRRPDVIASRMRAEAAAKRVDVTKADFYPNVNLQAFIGFQSLELDRLFKSGSQVGSIGPAVSLPIFNSGRLKAQYRNAYAVYDEAVAQYNQTVTQALNEVADATTSRRALGAELDRSMAAVEAAREAWEVARQRYQGGLSSYLDVLSAEDVLLGNLRSLSDLQSRAFTLDVALVRALGGGYPSAS